MPPRPRLKLPPTPRLLRPPTHRAHSTSSSLPPEPPSRWLSDLRTRLGKCLSFGCTTPQTAHAAAVLRALATEWRVLTAGSDGFLTGHRRGLEGQKVVWGEMDAFGHVNNVTYNRYAESSRVNWMNYFATRADPAHRTEWLELMSPRKVGLIMKSLRTEFKFPMVYPDTISVYHKLRETPATNPPPTSLLVESVILSHRHRRVAARTYEDIVIYDYKAARKAEMPRFMREVLSETWELQLQETERARTRIWELIGTVEALEKGTWDRENAVEDLGGAGKR